MSSFLTSKSTTDLAIDPAEPPSLTLNRRKNAYGGGQSSPTNFGRTESKYLGRFRIALLVACITAFLISIRSYDPSRSHSGSQDVFSSVCLPTQSSCLLRLYLPNVLVDPPAIVFITSVLGFFTLVFEFHGIRRADIYQDQILVFGVICGSIWCGISTFRGEGVSAFKNFMPGVITAALATSAVIHTFLEKWSSV